ncbi:hypothetical protein CI105_08615 [Candidatus Izimaplasma bacterium ZiA1]|uniref:DUF4393 domain-containing protein n=1 Tax=Candidatus Izimoplasma sp. ZiA1 TaxID=2024899 RepID=UPI000BAA4EDF|nr:hypothetical protein CI105_08615 [Candidatus Izimaplasma bacterium ZiA1]
MGVRKEITKEIAKETGKLVPELYIDAIKPTMIIVGERLSMIADMILSPIEFLGIGKKRLIDWMSTSVALELRNVIDENIIEPDPVLAVPIIQQISYSYGHEHLRNMYAKLLAKSMDKEMAGYVRTAYVEILKQLSSMDVEIFEQFDATKVGKAYILLGHKLTSEDTSYKLDYDMMHTILRCKYTFLEVNLCIQNLSRLGLIEIQRDLAINNDKLYEEIMDLKEYSSVFEEECYECDELVYIKRGQIKLTYFGYEFMKLVQGE